MDEEGAEDSVKILYPFILQFPHKHRIFYLPTSQERDSWVHKLQKTLSEKSIHDYYEITETLGKGKYGIVKKGELKSNPSLHFAIKIVTKSQILCKDKELVNREISVLKMCNHQNIIKF